MASYSILFCFSLHEVAIPLARLIPFISGLFKKLSCDAPNPLVQVFFNNVSMEFLKNE